MPTLAESNTQEETTMSKRITLSDWEIELLVDLLADDADLRREIAETDSALMRDYHLVWANTSALLIERLTGTAPEWLQNEREIARLERAFA
jgi:hypothetical protein